VCGGRLLEHRREVLALPAAEVEHPLRPTILDRGDDGVPDEGRQGRRDAGDELGVPVEVVASRTAPQLVRQLAVEVEVVPAEGLDHGSPGRVGGERPAAAAQRPAAGLAPDQTVGTAQLEQRPGQVDIGQADGSGQGGGVAGFVRADEGVDQSGLQQGSRRGQPDRGPTVPERAEPGPRRTLASNLDQRPRFHDVQPRVRVRLTSPPRRPTSAAERPASALIRPE
jgi:hypothetical protein